MQFWIGPPGYVGGALVSRQGTAFDYSSPAELYLSRRRGRHTDYRRFGTAAEAIRYAVKELRTRRSLSAWMQVGDETFNKSEINRLYYPLNESLSAPPVERLGSTRLSVRIDSAAILALEKSHCLKRFRRINRFRARLARSECPVSEHCDGCKPSITLCVRPQWRLRWVGAITEELSSR
jgi:Arc/MetJ-type ribon-helix-helix transcriptional regulator